MVAPDPDPTPPYYFCFRYIRSIADFAYAILAVALTASLLTLAIKRFVYLRMLQGIKQTVKEVFIYSLIWGILSISEFTTDAVLYSNGYKPISETNVFSTVEFFFTISCGFLVQGLFILVAYTQSTNIFKINGDRGENFPIRLMNFYRGIRIYGRVRHFRIIFLVLMFFLLLLDNPANPLNIVAVIELSLDTCDSIACSIVLICVYRSILTPYLFEKDLPPFSDKQKNSLRKQFKILIVCAIYRLISLIILLAKFSIEWLSGHQCQGDANPLLNTLQLYFFGPLFLQIIPIFAIIWVQLPPHTEQPIVETRLQDTETQH